MVWMTQNVDGRSLGSVISDQANINDRMWPEFVSLLQDVDVTLSPTSAACRARA